MRLPLLILSVLFPIIASAQIDTMGLLDLQLTMANRNFTVSGTPADRATYISLLERKVALSCFRNLARSLEYSPAKGDKNCTDAIETILPLDAANPVALCARDGLSAPMCIGAYRQQRVGAYDANSNAWQVLGTDLRGNIQLSTEISVEQRKNSQKLDELRFTLRSMGGLARTDPTKVQSAIDLANQALVLACKNPQLALVPAAPTASPKEESALGESNHDALSPSAAKTPNPMDSLLAQLNKEKPVVPTPTPIPFGEPRFERIRLLPRICLDFIEMAKKEAPASSEIVCAEIGAFSPSCILARQYTANRKALSNAAAAGTANPNAKSAPNQPTQFDTF